MYRVHHTEAIIFAYADRGEADRLYVMYTKDHGKLSIFAKGVRHEKSKLRYHLSLFARVRVSFVEGKDILRLIDAEELEAPSADERAWFIARRSAAFICRMVAGSERDVGLWGVIAPAFRMFATARSIPALFEDEFKARVLHQLGYLEDERANADAVREALVASGL